MLKSVMLQCYVKRMSLQAAVFSGKVIVVMKQLCAPARLVSSIHCRQSPVGIWIQAT